MPTISFDGPSKIIDIGYDSATTTVRVIDIYSRWKDWVKAGNAQWDQAFEGSVGGNPLGGGVELDAYIFLRNDLGWRIRAADVDHTLVIDGQLFGFSPAVAVYLSRPARTITYREAQSSRSQLVNADADAASAAQAYQGMVWIDEDSAFAGTDYPTGSSVQPVNNLNDAVSIASLYGIRDFRILGHLHFAHDVSGLHFIGEPDRHEIHLTGPANVNGASFEMFTIGGSPPMLPASVFDNEAHLIDCHIVDVTGFNGTATRCLFVGNCGIDGFVTLKDCYGGHFNSGHHPVVTDGPSFDFGGGGHHLSAFGWSGVMRLEGMGTGSQAMIDMTSGVVIIEATCTAGEVIVRGVGEPIVDLSGGAVTIDDSGYITSSKIVDPLVGHIWAAS